MNILILSDNPPPLGGAELHIELLKKLLTKKGHHAETFFFNNYAKSGSRSKAAQELKKLLSKETFDIAHIHAIEYFYSDCINVLAENRIPIFHTLHDYRCICPTGDCFREGEICSECLGGCYFKAGIYGCYNIVGAFKRYICDTVLRQDLLNIKKVRRYISPSLFLKSIHEKSNFKGKIEHIFNFIDVEKYRADIPTDKKNPYILFFGRLMPNKGIMTLLDAVKGTGVRLRIAGTGPLENTIKQKIAEEKGFEKTTLEGFKKGDELFKLIGEASLSVTPSEWWENLPFSIVESFALATPAIGSNIGGIPELVTTDRGALFEPKNKEELREKLTELMSDSEKLEEMGKAARKFIFANMNEEAYYKKIIKIYKEA